MKKHKEQPTLTDCEKEILIFKAVVESIDSMLNHEILILNHNDPNSEIRFNSPTSQKYFNIILLDFLCATIWGIDKNCLGALQGILENPQYSGPIERLKNAVDDFQGWLNQDVEFEHNGTPQKLWFPSRNKEVALKITRSEFIKICGNISKHNILTLNRQACLIKEIFKKNNADLELTDAILIMEDFYEHFHGNLLTYHSSAIAEFLNNIRWAVHEYLQPLHKKSIQNIYPDGVNNPYAKEIFADLMNRVRSEPYMPKFVVTRFLKMRY